MKGAVGAAIAVLVLGAACGGGGSSTKAARAVSDVTTTLPASATASTSSTVAVPTTVAATRTTRTTANGTTNAAANGDVGHPGAAAGPPKPPAAGTYTYDTTGTVSFGGAPGSFPARTTLVVDPPQGVSQHSTRDERDSSGNGSVGDTTLEFRPAGVFIDELKTTTRAFGVSDVTDLTANPPALVLATGAKPGDHLVFDMSGSGVNAHVTIDVVRTETVSIGGQSVDTLVVHQAAALSGKADGSTVADNWVSPQYDMIVKEHTVSDFTAYGSRAHSDETSTLERLTPS